MAKYRKKPVIVEAEVYKPGMEDGWDLVEGDEVKNFVKKACCKIGWHSYFAGFDIFGNDGLSLIAKCKWCGKQGLLDSYGQLF